MPSRAMRFEGRPISSPPRKRIEPRRWPRIPMIARRVVVLPAPLRPSRVTTSPSSTVKSMPCRTCDSPYQACNPATSSSAGAASGSGMAGPHIGFDDLRIVRDRGVVALGENAPAGQNRDGLRQIGDDRQIVLDHQHGALARSLPDQPGDAADILEPEA